MTSEAVHAVTFFPSQYETIPSAEHSGLTPERVIELIAPEDGPRIVTEKAHAPFFVPCLLAVAPYVGKTSERFSVGAVGKQRSASHVTVSSWLALDLDDISDGEMTLVLRKLEGLAYVAYSTHSHGKVAGVVRVRVVVFLDRALDPMEWMVVWHVLNKTVFDSKADKASAKMHQAAGVWCAHPDRVAQSFRYGGLGAVLCADNLLALAPKPKPVPLIEFPCAPPRGGRQWRYADALRWLDAGDYATWQAGLMSLKASVELGDMTDTEGCELWVAWSREAPGERQKLNSRTQYDPIAMWYRKQTLATPAQILVASLFSKAKVAAEQRYTADIAHGRTDADQRAELYLLTHHKAAFRQLKAVA